MDHLEPKVFIVELHRILGSTLNPSVGVLHEILNFTVLHDRPPVGQLLLYSSMVFQRTAYTETV